jgi:hypothetical protein
MAVQDMALAPRFRVSEVIGKSLSIWLKNWLPFAVLGIVFNIPVAIFGYQMFEEFLPLQQQILSGQPADPTQISHIFGWAFWAGWLVFVICYQLLTAAIAYGVVQRLRGQAVSLVGCFNQAFRRFFPIILTGLAAAVLTWLACLLFVIPGIIVALNFYVAIPVCIIEGLGVSGSLSRAKELARGYRWKLLGIILIAAVIAVVIQQILGFAIRFAVPVGTTLTSLVYVSVGTLVINQVIFTTLIAAIATCAYYYLRVAKEGVDIDQIAAVFD